MLIINKGCRTETLCWEEDMLNDVPLPAERGLAPPLPGTKGFAPIPWIGFPLCCWSLAIWVASFSLSAMICSQSTFSTFLCQNFLFSLTALQFTVHKNRFKQEAQPEPKLHMQRICSANMRLSLRPTKMKRNSYLFLSRRLISCWCSCSRSLCLFQASELVLFWPEEHELCSIRISIIVRGFLWSDSLCAQYNWAAESRCS